MYNKIHLFSVLIFSLSMLNCQTNTKSEEQKITYKVSKTDKEWREELSPEEYDILRNKGTERPHTGIYNMHFEEGVYRCKGCGQALFKSNNKFMLVDP